jgi:hypothetical protein
MRGGSMTVMTTEIVVVDVLMVLVEEEATDAIEEAEVIKETLGGAKYEA